MLLESSRSHPVVFRYVPDWFCRIISIVYHITLFRRLKPSRLYKRPFWHHQSGMKVGPWNWCEPTLGFQVWSKNKPQFHWMISYHQWSLSPWKSSFQRYTLRSAPWIAETLLMDFSSKTVFSSQTNSFIDDFPLIFQPKNIWKLPCQGAFRAQPETAGALGRTSWKSPGRRDTMPKPMAWAARHGAEEAEYLGGNFHRCLWKTIQRFIGKYGSPSVCGWTLGEGDGERARSMWDNSIKYCTNHLFTAMKKTKVKSELSIATSTYDCRRPSKSSNPWN